MEIANLRGSGVQEVIRDSTRVVLIGARYTPEPSEPVFGSAHTCEGLIIDILRGPHSDYDVRVNWDNKCSNAYQIKDLRAVKPVNSNNPNHNFRIWKLNNEKRKSK